MGSILGGGGGGRLINLKRAKMKKTFVAGSSNLLSRFPFIHVSRSTSTNLS